MLRNTFYNNLFKDYYFNNKGIFFKTFEININNINNRYEIYWGDPDIIFDRISLKEKYPLALTIIPRKKNAPHPRIFLHEKLEKKFTNSFEMVIAHEIGHLWLHDVVGVNHPMTNNSMEEYETEIWSDYFAYEFFVKYRNVYSLEIFNKIIEEAINLQMYIYNLNPEQYMKYVYTERVENLKILDNKVKIGVGNRDQTMIQMLKAIEITLYSLGDVFK